MCRSETKQPYSGKALVPRLGVHRANDFLWSAGYVAEEPFRHDGVRRRVAVHEKADNLDGHETDGVGPVFGHLDEFSVVPTSDDAQHQLGGVGRDEGHGPEVDLLRPQPGIEGVHHQISAQATHLIPRTRRVLQVGRDVGSHYQVDHWNTLCLAAVHRLL